MSDGYGEMLGVSAARRLAVSGRTLIRPGLTAREFDEVEQRFGFEFADDHRAFLAAGLPVWTEGDDDPGRTTDLGWPDWRDGDPAKLRDHLDFALEGALLRVEHGYWHPWWGDERPREREEALRVARGRVTGDGLVVPLYVHRFMPAGRGRWGHPVLSIWGVDVVYYGPDLADYVDREFNVADDPDGDGVSGLQGRAQCPETFWTQLADWNARGCPLPAV